MITSNSLHCDKKQLQELPTLSTSLDSLEKNMQLRSGNLITKLTIPRDDDGLILEPKGQFEARLHSHLLTGRLENHTLLSYAASVVQSQAKTESRLISPVTSSSEDGAPKQTLHLIQKRVSGILKTIKDSGHRRQPAKADERLSQQSEELSQESRREEESAEHHFGDASQRSRRLKRRRELKGISKQKRKLEFASVNGDFKDLFRQSETHFLKAVNVHPERDVKSVRVIDQVQKSESELETRMQQLEKQHAEARNEQHERLSIGSMSNSDESTYQSANHLMQSKKAKRRIQINDVVEVYFYPKKTVADGEDSEESDCEPTEQKPETKPLTPSKVTRKPVCSKLQSASVLRKRSAPNSFDTLFSSFLNEASEEIDQFIKLDQVARVQDSSPKRRAKEAAREQKSKVPFMSLSDTDEPSTMSVHRPAKLSAISKMQSASPILNQKQAKPSLLVKSKSRVCRALFC